MNSKPVKLVTKLFFLICLIVGPMKPAPARADQYYPFIKMDCDKAAKTMSVSMIDFDDPGQMLPKVRVGEVKDVYYMVDLSKERKTVKCNLGKKQVVSVIARYDGVHVANDTLGFYFNGKSIHNLLLEQYYKFSIKALGPQEAVLRACPTHLWAAAKEEVRKTDKDGCLMIHFKSGKTAFE